MEPGIYDTSNDRTIVVPKATYFRMRAHPIPHLTMLAAFERLVTFGEGYAGERTVETVDMGEIVGTAGSVVTPMLGLDDDALFCRRTNRKFPTRCVRAEPLPTSKITMVLINDDQEGDFTLLSAWAGDAARPEPANLSDTDNLDFWRSHALIFGRPQFVGQPFVSTWRKEMLKREQQQRLIDHRTSVGN